MNYIANITTETKNDLTPANSPSRSVYAEPYISGGDIEANSYADLVQQLEKYYAKNDRLDINSAHAQFIDGGLGTFTDKALDMLYADVVKANSKRWN